MEDQNLFQGPQGFAGIVYDGGYCVQLQSHFYPYAGPTGKASNTGPPIGKYRNHRLSKQIPVCIILFVAFHEACLSVCQCSVISCLYSYATACMLSQGRVVT